MKNRSGYAQLDRISTSSYHRPSPTIQSYGSQLGLGGSKPNPLARHTQSDDRDLGEQHWAHCMDYAAHLWMEIYDAA